MLTIILKSGNILNVKDSITNHYKKGVTMKIGTRKT